MTRPPKFKAIERLRKVLDEIPALEHLQSGSVEFLKWQRNAQVAIAKTFGDKSNHSTEFNNIYFSTPSPFYPRAYEQGLNSAAAMLKSMIEEIKEYWEDEQRTQIPPSAQGADTPGSNKVFVVHGRDGGTKETVARFLETLDLEPVILHEQPNEGRTIIEKFEEHAQVGFAVVLLTPDDSCRLQDDEGNFKPRARQNVIFEFGYFIGKLGRERVCAFTKGNVEIPSDYDGVVYIPLDGSGGWKTTLTKELKNVGFDVDANKAL